MKISSIVFLSLSIGFSTSSITAQETVWFDVNLKKTLQYEGEYYRPTPKRIKHGYWIVDYYRSGQVRMEGFSKVRTLGEEEFEGLVIHYFENGNTSQKSHYKNGKLHGLRKVYYESGELREQGRYDQGERSGIWKTYYKNGKIIEKGKYRDNQKSGIWKTFHKNTR